MIDEWGKGAKYWDKAWNPIIGCRAVSEGCEHCYAARMAEKFPELQDEFGSFWPHYPKNLKNPPKSGVVFAGNMTDLFGGWNDGDVIHNWLRGLSTEATNLVLTKRAGRLRDLPDSLLKLDHIYYGITAENQDRMICRAAQLIKSGATNKWLSLEPLLGEILLNDAVMNIVGELDFFDSLRKWFQWVVVGAESGPERRPCNLEWVRQIVNECLEARVPVFVKQLDIDGKLVKDINQFPEDLQIRQVPWKGGTKP